MNRRFVPSAALLCWMRRHWQHHDPLALRRMNASPKSPEMSSRTDAGTGIGFRVPILSTPKPSASESISQVILESVILTTMAGYIGLVLGVGIVEGVNYLLVTTGADGSMFTNPEVNFSVAMQALEVLVISGILAGLIPAYRAVSMKPIDALRNE